MLTTGILNLNNLDKNYSCVVQLVTQPPNVLHQVTLRPDKVSSPFIRLGETTGDEAYGWVAAINIHVMHILGTAKEEHDKTWTVEPLIKSIG